MQGLRKSPINSGMLNQARGLQSQMRAPFLHCLQALCGNHNRHSLAEFGNEKHLLLQIYLAAALARRVELSRADAIGIPAADD